MKNISNQFFEGYDSSTFKTITFNCVDNELGSYLLKKNIKNFNILGKLSLNEWRGQKNVEFIMMIFLLLKSKKIRSHRSIG